MDAQNSTPRETKEITTPGGHTAVVKTYLTIGEVNDALRVILKGRNASADATVPLEVAIERNMQLILAALVSLDGLTDNLGERVRNLKLSDYNAIFAEVKDLSEGSF
jgi:hypothetical protein